MDSNISKESTIVIWEKLPDLTWEALIAVLKQHRDTPLPINIADIEQIIALAEKYQIANERFPVTELGLYKLLNLQE